MIRRFSSLLFSCLLGLCLPGALGQIPASSADRDTAALIAALPPGAALIDANGFAINGDPSTYRFARKGPASDPVFEVTTVREISPQWAIQLIARTTSAVKKNDYGLLRFRARVTETKHETGQGRLRVVVQRVGGDFQQSVSARYDLPGQWTEFFVPVRFASDYAVGETGVFFGFGFSAQTVEIEKVSLVNFGPSVTFADLPRTRVTYDGAAPDAPWRAAAEARIERIRKGDVSVYVTDSSGQPVANAKIELEMRQHHFEFGSAVPFSLLMDESPDREPFRKALFSVFNAVGPENDLKWRFWADGGRPRQTATLAALRWLKDQRIPVRGHVLIWPAAKRMPESAVALLGTDRQDEIPAMVLAHIREIAAATAGLVSEWDVLNEPFSHHQLMDLFGREIMADWFKTAREALGPDIPLYFNDWGNHDFASDPIHGRHFIDTARFIMARGGPIDGLGLQAHIGGVPPSPERLLATLDQYQRELGLPVRVTEFDFTTDDPQLHADYSRDFLIAYFSHPLTAGIQFWGFWEKSHWRPAAALFNADWSERPAGTAVRKLLRETWWTRAQGSTDSVGRYATRGFYGRYVARATVGNRIVETEFKLLPGALPSSVRLVLP